MKILRYTASWNMNNDETIDYILECFYNNFFVKLPKSLISYVSLTDHSVCVDGDHYIKTIIRFIVHRKDFPGQHRTFELDTDNGWISRD